MIRPLLAAFLIATLPSCGEDSPAPTNTAAPAMKAKAPDRPAPVPETARVRLTTAMGDIVVELDGRRAPLTTGNFVAYVERGRFDGTSFYRAARTRGAPERGFVQGGIRSQIRRSLPPIAHEPTSETGLRHRDGTISMARREGGAGAMGDFFITIGAMPSMDADADGEGFAAFGRVVEGMDVVRRILAAETAANAGSGAMRGQLIEEPVQIVRARSEQ